MLTMLPSRFAAALPLRAASCDRIRRQAHGLRADRRGNVTLIFALSIIPLVGAVAVAVDYSRGNSARTAMQAVLDATTLMISKEALDLKTPRSRPRPRPTSTASSPAPTCGASSSASR